MHQKQTAIENGGGIYLLALELQHHMLAFPDDEWVLSLPSRPQTPLEWPQDSVSLRSLVKSPGAKLLLQRQQQGLKSAVANILAPVREKFEWGGMDGVERIRGEALTDEGFRRCVSLVLSRAFEVMINDEKHLVILPVVDWLNHSSSLAPSPPPVSFDRDSSTFRVRAVEKYAKGDHVWITYGTKVRDLADSPFAIDFQLCPAPVLNLPLAPDAGDFSHGGF